ncbi:MAG: hypothetical protein Ct9H300mP6_09900 [Gammaproteobacteria bacterium]|nr:MAG: hypothetical protein Ct9H300mP6_09900 [Gammaproteobacteria bacterium]
MHDTIYKGILILFLYISTKTMTIKSDNWIKQMANDHKMIEPFTESQIRKNGDQDLISYGTSSFGYDVRCANEFKVFTNINSAVVDPKNFDESSFVDLESDICIIPPNSFALARTVEFFRIPRNVLTICLGKSTYARCGIIVNVTPLKPEWEGHVTLEFSKQPHFQQRFMPMKALLKWFFSSQMKIVTNLTKTDQENIKANWRYPS